MDKPSDNPSGLPYPLAYRKRSRLRFNRRLMVISFVAIAFLICTRWHRYIITRSQVLWFQTGCLRYVDRSETPVYAEIFEEQIPKLLEQYPTLLSKRTELPPRVGRLVNDWTQLRQRIQSEQQIDPEATLFVGKLRSSSGDVRLVGVELSRRYATSSRLAYGGASLPPLTFQMDSVRPMGFFTPDIRPVQTIAEADFMGDLRPLYRGDFKIFPGRIDPSNESRFEAKLIIGQHIGRLLGTLSDDGSIGLKLEGFESR
jgi:hypothetical protein